MILSTRIYWRSYSGFLLWIHHTDLLSFFCRLFLITVHKIRVSIFLHICVKTCVGTFVRNHFEGYNFDTWIKHHSNSEIVNTGTWTTRRIPRAKTFWVPSSITVPR